ncbi:MAG: ferredoxin [Mycoplasmoidaceae bacterium]
MSKRNIDLSKIICIDKDKCISCGACISLSPNQAIKYDDDFKAEVIEEKATEADEIVIEVCPTEAIFLKERTEKK